MNHITLFLIEIAMSLALSFIVLALITAPLTNFLKSICESDEQALFWLAYTRSMLIISPLLGVIVVGALADANGLTHIKVTSIACLAGLFLGLVLIGRNLYTPSRQTCNEQNLAQE